MANRAENMVSFISQLRAYAAAQAVADPSSEWNLLPGDDTIVANLIGTGRKMNRIIEGVGQKLRVLRFQGGTADMAVIAGMKYDELVSHPVNKAAAVAASVSVDDPVSKLIAALPKGDNIVQLPPVESKPFNPEVDPVVEPVVAPSEEVAGIFSEIRDQVEETETKRPRRR